MKESKRHAEQICNRMLKGMQRNFPIPDDQRALFVERFLILAEFMLPYMPKGVKGTFSASVGAAICKCALKHGLLKAINFSESVKRGIFNGPNDPARILWDYLMRNECGRTNSTDIYCKTVYAARAWCEGKVIKRGLRAAKIDFFEWDATYRYPATVVNQNESVVSSNNVSKETPIQSP